MCSTVVLRSSELSPTMRSKAPLDGRHAELTHPVGILTERLFDSPPAGIARHIHHRAQRRADAARPDLACGHRIDRAHQVRVPTDASAIA
jgi:hypothetical protein